MAENNSIRANNASGYSEDFAQQLTSFAHTNQELRDVIKALAGVVSNLDKSVSTSNKSTSSNTASKSKRDREYEANLKALRECTDVYKEANSMIKSATKDIYKSFGELTDYQKEQLKIAKNIEETKHKMEIAQLTDNEEAVKKYAEEMNRLTEDLAKSRQKYNAETKLSQKRTDIRNEEKEFIKNLEQSVSDLSSKTAAFKSERLVAWENAKSSFGQYFTPKKSTAYKEVMDAIASKRTSLGESRTALNLALMENRSALGIKQNAIAAAQEELTRKDLTESQRDAVQRELVNLQSEEKIIEEKIESLKREAEVVDAQEKLIDKESLSIDKSASVLNNIKDSALKFIQKTLTSAVDKELDNIRSAANEVFSSFESTQKTIAKQLKLSSGEYDDLKQQLIDAANEAGKAIDVTQLNEAAVSISEMGIRDTDLIREMAVGIAKLSEAGVSAKLDEETAKQMNATYTQLVKSGIDSATAAETVGKRFDDMIAINQQIQEQYGNTFALENGGWQEIMNWVNKVEGMGLIGSEEDRQALMASLANSQAALASAGITDPSAMLSTVESMMQNPLGENSAFVYDWMRSYGENLGVTDINSLYEQLGKGKGGDILMSLNKRAAELAQQSDYNATAYLKQAYGMDLTTEQLVGLSRLGEAESSYGNADFSSTSLKKYGQAVAKGLEEGKYLTATEKLAKTNMELVQKTASISQDIPNGDFLMGTFLDGISGVVHNATEFLLAGLFSGNLFGGGTSGSGKSGGLGSLSGSGNAGAFGIGSASYGTMAVGGVLSGASAIKNFYNAESFEDGLIDTFRDPTFTAGLGTTIGGAVGGPIGGAIGGALGAFVPTVSKALEKWALSTVHDPVVEAMERQTEQLEIASTKMTEAANNHMNAANSLEDEINEQQAIFNSYDENQKISFLKQQGISDEQIETLEKQGTINSAFEDAVTEWIAGLQKEKANEELLASGADDLMGSFASAIDVENSTNKWVSEAEGRKSTALLGTFGAKMLGIQNYDTRESMEARAAQLGLSEKAKDLDDKGLAKLLNDAEESLANTNAVRNEAGFKTIENAKQYMSNLGKDVDTATAVTEYLEAMGTYDNDKVKLIAAEAAAMEKDKAAYSSANDTFHSELQKILNDNPNITSYSALLAEYSNRHSDFKMSNLEEYSKTDAGDILIDGASRPDLNNGKLPDLRYSAKGDHYAYDPALYDGAFLTGLDYVPMDNFLALLHQGEMVLTKNEAETYRNSFNSNDITNSVDSQTDKLIDILNKILQVLTLKYSSGSSLPKSLVQMNSDISLLG